MTDTQSVSSDTATPAARRSRWRPSGAPRIAIRTAAPFVVGGWVLAAIFLAVATPVYASLDSETTKHSLWEPALVGMGWLLLGAAGATAWLAVPLLIQHGVTRRKASRSIIAVVLTLSVGTAVLGLLGYVGEQVVYGEAFDVGNGHLFSVDALRYDGVSVAAPSVLDLPGEAAVVLLEILIGSAAYSAAGLIIGTALHQRHWSIAAMITIGAVFAAWSTQWLMFAAGDSEIARANQLSPWLGALLAAAVTTALFAIVDVGIRHVRIKPKRS